MAGTNEIVSGNSPSESRLIEMDGKADVVDGVESCVDGVESCVDGVESCVDGVNVVDVVDVVESCVNGDVNDGAVDG